MVFLKLCFLVSLDQLYILKLWIRPAYFSTFRMIFKVFEHNLSSERLLESFGLEEIFNIFFKRTFAFIFRILTLQNPTHLELLEANKRLWLSARAQDIYLLNIGWHEARLDSARRAPPLGAPGGLPHPQN